MGFGETTSTVKLSPEESREIEFPSAISRNTNNNDDEIAIAPRHKLSAFVRRSNKRKLLSPFPPRKRK